MTPTDFLPLSSGSLQQRNGGFFRLRVRVPRAIARREQVDLVTEEGVFHLAVHESDENTIELRAYEGMRPDQS